jgi:hypothetical protein
VNRKQRRRASKVGAKGALGRVRFEEDLREALSIDGIRLISVNEGVEQNTKTPVWVFTVHDGQGSMTIRSGTGPLADIANGIVRTCRDLRAKEAASAGGPVEVEHVTEVAPPAEPELTFEEKVRALEARKAAQ